MKRCSFATLLVVGCLAMLLAACGGSSGGGGGLSADQQVFESFALSSNGGTHSLYVNIPASGAPSAADGRYLEDDALALSASPSTGTQAQINTRNRLAATLTSRTVPAVRADTVYVKAGNFVPQSGDPSYGNVSYSGSGVKLCSLAADNSTVLGCTLASNYSKNNLSGSIPTALGGIQGFWAPELASNSSLWKAGATFSNGAAYSTAQLVLSGNSLRVNADLCTTASNTATTITCTPTVSGKTLATVTWPLHSNDEYSSDFNQDYQASDGTTSTIEGVKVWVATNSFSDTSTYFPSTVSKHYRAFIESNNNLYAGWLDKDGTPIQLQLTASATPTTTALCCEFNKAAIDSIKAGFAY